MIWLKVVFWLMLDVVDVVPNVLVRSASEPKSIDFE